MCVFFKNHLEKTWSQSSKCSLLLNLPLTSDSQSPTPSYLGLFWVQRVVQQFAELHPLLSSSLSLIEVGWIQCKSVFTVQGVPDRSRGVPQHSGQLDWRLIRKYREQNQIRPMGYKTCRVLNSSLDATVCAKDCDRLKEQDFATKCRDKGGLYKCCIRRDAAFCHECRYLNI